MSNAFNAVMEKEEKTNKKRPFSDAISLLPHNLPCVSCMFWIEHFKMLQLQDMTWVLWLYQRHPPICVSSAALRATGVTVLLIAHALFTSFLPSAIVCTSFTPVWENDFWVWELWIKDPVRKLWTSLCSQGSAPVLKPVSALYYSKYNREPISRGYHWLN